VADGLEQLSVEELRALLAMRSPVAANLQNEVAALQREPRVHEERMRALERMFGHVRKGDIIKLRAPLLHEIAHIIHVDHALQHEKARYHQQMMTSNRVQHQVEQLLSHAQIQELRSLLHKMGVEQEHENQYQVEKAYAESRSFAFGRGYMPLDRVAIAQAEAEEELRAIQDRRVHPVVRDFHYAGNLSVPAEDAGVVFMGPNGTQTKRVIRPTPYKGNFWLDDVAREEHRASATFAMQSASEDPVAWRVYRTTTSGAGEDAAAIDWLGRAKRGLPPPPHNQGGWVVPPWMY